MTPHDYRSRFTEWDRRSWVRAKPHRDSPFTAGAHYFSPELCPLSACPPVRAAPRHVREAVLVHSLYLHLEFTVQLEMGPVNEICALLRSPRFLPWLPAGMKDDVLRIYTDEAGHAEMSNTLKNAVAAETGVVPVEHRPRFLGALAALYSAELPAYRPLVKLFFAIVSETLITGTLTRLPKDPSVQAAVRELAQDHAADEGRHHAFFRALFELLWPRMPVPLRRKVGVLLPRVIHAFLWPDEPALVRVLATMPEHFADPAAVVAGLAASPACRDAVLRNAAPTLRMFRDNGVFDDPVLAAAFADAGLPGRTG
ncbi:diiron oxygenase [Saccharothrix syringae]|uniref:diiron oxygenase n=1 Tax=Saccharothrix syringae TaxID=103733 RepID=UPI001476E685|nr:diiron oxygenase [Saccharothrix syringae]